METLGHRIRALREARKLSQTQLAERLGWYESRLSSYENDKRTPRVPVLKELAQALQCKVEDFITQEALLNVERIEMQPRHKVPLISWVRAGQSHTAASPYEPGDIEEWIETEINVTNTSFALVVRGDSMEPLFPEGCIIVVDPNRSATHGSYVVARMDESDEVTFKQLIHDGGLTYLKPINARYPIIKIDRDASICGVVVEMIQRRRFIP